MWWQKSWKLCQQWTKSKIAINFDLSWKQKNYIFRDIADLFSVAFFEEYRQTINVYSFTDQNLDKNTAKSRSYQRFEQCLLFLQSNFGPAFEALIAQENFDQATQKAATEFVEEAVKDSINEIKVSIKIDDEIAREKLIKTLEAMKLSVMFPDEILNQNKVEEIYNELDESAETLLDVYMKIKSYKRKIDTEMSDSWIKKIHEKLSDTLYVKYSVNINTLSEFIKLETFSLLTGKML